MCNQSLLYPLILRHFLPFYHSKNQKSKFWKNEKKVPRAIIILHMFTVNDYHMIYGSSDTECDRQNSLSFWTIFCRLPPSPPQTTQKIKIFGNIKKPPGDIICLFLKLNFVCRQKWVGRKVAGMKKTFIVIFDPTWTHILARKGTNKEFLKQHFSQKRPKLYLYQFCDFKTD